MCFSLRVNLVLILRISRKGWLVPISVFDVFSYILSYNFFVYLTTKVFLCIIWSLELCTIVCKIGQMTKTTELFILIWVTRSKIKKNIIVGFVIKGLKFIIGYKLT